MDVFTELDLLNMSQRTFWESPIRFDEVEIKTEKPDEDACWLAFRNLAGMQRLDWEAMRSNIAALLRSSDQFTLPQLLDAHPPEGGTIEVLGYIQLAHDYGHEVDERHVEVVYVEDSDSDNGPRPYEIPRVVFHADQSISAEAGDSHHE
jgi:hypothetical protein